MTFVLDLAPDIEAKLQQQAAQLGVTVSDLITKMVEDGVMDGEDDEETPGEYTLRLAAELRATIPDEELAKVPPDWAMNPDKYRFAQSKGDA